MFTGLVVAQLPVRAFEPHPAGARLTLDAGGHRFARQPQPGDSISVAGVCLTVTGFDAGNLTFDIITETLGCTTLGQLAPGQRVNIEPALAAGDALGGHFVQGHVDAVGRITGRTADTAEHRLTIEPAPATPAVPATPTSADLMELIPPKGSITIDGVSLTVARVTPTQFDVALIPTTLELTTLGDLMPGDQVNLETDILTRAVVHHLRRQKPAGGEGVTRDLLREAGYINE
ncbi:MAG: riboflavin synthase [Phycisphaeraceae bacterium]